MRFRVCLVIVVVVAAAAAAIVGSAARGASRNTSAVHWALLPGTLRSASTPRIAGTQQLTVYASDFAATSVDNAPSGTSQGDELAVTGQLRDAAGTKLGKLEVHDRVFNRRNIRNLRNASNRAIRVQGFQQFVCIYILETPRQVVKCSYPRSTL